MGMTVAQARRASARSGRWALYDAEGGLWVSDPAGDAFRYDDPQVARLAAMAVAQQVGWPISRIQIRDLIPSEPRKESLW